METPPVNTTAATGGGAVSTAGVGTTGAGGTTSASGGAGAAAGGNASGSGSASGGASGGASGTGGSAGNAGAGGGVSGGLCTGGNCADFLGGFDGYMFEYPCVVGGNCPVDACVMTKLTVTKEFMIKGDPSKVYRVDLHVRGVTESKNYAGGMRRSALPMDPGPAGADLWYEGGTAPVSSYSSYELHVTPPVAGGPNDYYLNARDGTDEHDGTTWASNYQASIKVNGGGKITFKSYDSNCSEIKNCGPKGACMPRTFDLSDAVPVPTATQPVYDANKVPVQWLHIDVLAVEAM